MMTESTAPDRRLRRRERLRGRRNFSRVFADKRSAANGELVLYVAHNGLDDARIAVVVGRRMGNAVVRARIRRLLREFFRNNKREIPRGFDYICIPKPPASGNWRLTPTLALQLCLRATRRPARQQPRRSP